VTPHPQHTGRAPLTREQILTRAIEIIDAEGLDALSMRRLASEFQVEAMALYYYFANKQAILDGVVNTIVAEAFGDSVMPQGDDWRETMRVGILTVRRAMLAHPNAAPLITTHATDSPTTAVWVEGPISILHAAGLRGRALAIAYHEISAYALGWHLLASESTGAGAWHGAPTHAAEAPRAAELGELLADWDDGFEEGLNAILDSIDACITTPS
jgi:TetR/AcrR family transcriptional regulator, tetracycline repressor protein